MRKAIDLVFAFVSLMLITSVLWAQEAQENEFDENQAEEIDGYITPLWLPELLMNYRAQGITAEADLFFGLSNFRLGGFKQSIDGKIFFFERGRDYYSIQENKLIPREIDENIFSDQRIGLHLNYDTELVERIKVGPKLRLEHLTFWDRSETPLTKLYPQLNTRNDFQVVPGLQASADRRDSTVDTFEGWYSRVYLEGASESLGSTISFLATGLDWRQFFKLADNQTIGYNLVGRYGINLPFYEEFRAGWIKSLRGYPPDRFVGDLELRASTEYRFYLPSPVLEYPFLGRSFSHRLGFVLFADAGRAWDDRFDPTFPNDVAYDGGLGLALTLDAPGTLGVLRIDFAFSPENTICPGGTSSPTCNNKINIFFIRDVPTFLLPQIVTSHQF